MKTYVIVMKSGYEQKVKTERDVLRDWYYVVNGDGEYKSLKSYVSKNGDDVSIDLSEVAIVRVCNESLPFPPPPPPLGFRR